nr:PREDICTED: single Ig IL-1-related receptor [Opisthocomus hoazin]
MATTVARPARSWITFPPTMSRISEEIRQPTLLLGHGTPDLAERVSSYLMPQDVSTRGAKPTRRTQFVHFIVKPQLENRYGYKLFLDEQTILPNSEPSADLIMNVSRCRRLIVVLSVAYLEQDWCNSSFSTATAPAAGAPEDAQLRDAQRPELDVSDLGSRNYGARTDFYCLVTEDDI